MTPKQFKTALKALRLSRNKLAAVVKVNRRTVYRWASGESAVPEMLALLLTSWLREQRRAR
jgi:DNA-binding transcriptional regulator YiaG